MPRHIGAAICLVLVAGAAAMGLSRPEPSREPAPPPAAVPAAISAPVAGGEARWTRLPTVVTVEPGYQRLPAVERPADINPAPPQAAAPRTAAIPALVAPGPEEPEAEPLTLAERCRLPDADRAACRALREREARAAERRARERAAAAERQRAAEARRAPAPASAAFGVSPHYDLMR